MKSHILRRKIRLPIGNMLNSCKRGWYVAPPPFSMFGFPVVNESKNSHAKFDGSNVYESPKEVPGFALPIDCSVRALFPKKALIEGKK